MQLKEAMEEWSKYMEIKLLCKLGSDSEDKEMGDFYKKKGKNNF